MVTLDGIQIHSSKGMQEDLELITQQQYRMKRKNNVK